MLEMQQLRSNFYDGGSLYDADSVKRTTRVWEDNLCVTEGPGGEKQNKTVGGGGRLGDWNGVAF